MAFTVRYDGDSTHVLEAVLRELDGDDWAIVLTTEDSGPAPVTVVEFDDDLLTVRPYDMDNYVSYGDAYVVHVEAITDIHVV